MRVERPNSVNISIKALSVVVADTFIATHCREDAQKGHERATLHDLEVLLERQVRVALHVG